MSELSKQSTFFNSSSEKLILRHTTGRSLGERAASCGSDGRSRRIGNRRIASLAAFIFGVNVAAC
ncbi:Uncharacterized protein APZ42_020304 [Daphnia magna]|uniref:Uncharacterized protein n=1 Tax=Daphnia magna TaxID=35525 RepID=A0A162CD15_9CRUS|nr:Uncharacterized protein APZ42_020304 [Daphnia magna]